MIELTCPKCGGTLQTDEKREFIFCEYCGHKIMMETVNVKIDHNITYKEINKAKIQKEKRKSSVAKSIRDIFESFFDMISDFFDNLFIIILFILLIGIVVYARMH